MPQVVEQPKATPLPQPETQVPAEVPQEKPETKLSPQYAALAKREKMIFVRDRELKVREKALADKETEYQTSYIPKNKIAERAKTDPLGWMEEVGITPDEFTQALLNANPQDAALRKLRAELEAVKESQTQTLTKIEDQQKKAYEQAINQIRSEAKLLVDGDENYETIKEEGAYEAVVELVTQTFNEEGTLMSVQEAAKAVEEYLVEEGFRKAQLKKVKAKLIPQAPQKTESQQTQIKTLTNAVTAPSKKGLTDKERRERAIAAFKGQLN